ncbi:MAG: hypothetical protein JNJ75_04495 [Cyclobacteriaceae bacterium]|nr:hypothetical protein [Cyclobacteriaceae bacterium]
MREKALLELHYRIQALIKERPELNGFDVRKGSPFFELISLKALSKKELIEKHGRTVLCIEVDLLKDLVLTIITYNFFKKYKTRAMELFTEAESKMKALVEENKLPGRFSWNTFVIKDEKQKDEEFDSSALNQYGEFDDGNSEDEANSNVDTDLDSPEII